MGLGLGTVIIGLFLIWRIFVIEENLNSRIDELDRGLGAVVGNIIERMDAIGANVTRYQPNKSKSDRSNP